MAGLALTVLQHALALPRLFTYEHAWVSADNALQARYFHAVGIIHSHGVPVNNNAPFGIASAAYVHWPPLFPIFLSFWFHGFGESESAVHSFALLIQLVILALLYGLLRISFGRDGAAVGCLIWLACPGSIGFGNAGLHLHLAIAFLLAAVLVFVRSSQLPPRSRFWLLGCGAIALGAMSSWEAVLAPAGLMAGCRLLSDRRGVRRGSVYLLAGAASAAGVLAWYFRECPLLVADTWQTIRFRLGITSLYSSRVLYNQAGQEHLALHTAARGEVANLMGAVGLAGLALMAAYLATQADHHRARKCDHTVVAFLGMLAPLVLWFGLFWNHAAIHTYESILALAPAAFAGAWAFLRLQERLREQGRASVRLAAVSWGIPAVLLLPLIANLYDTTAQIRRHQLQAPDREVLLGRTIQRSTPPGSIILTPEPSLVPVWYSLRNTAREIRDDAQVSQALEELRRTLPGRRIYLIVGPQDQSRFAQTRRAYPQKEIGNGIVRIDLQEANYHAGSAVQ